MTPGEAIDYLESRLDDQDYEDWYEALNILVTAFRDACHHHMSEDKSLRRHGMLRAVWVCKICGVKNPAVFILSL